MDHPNINKANQKAILKAEKLISFLEEEPEDLEVVFYKNEVSKIKNRERLFSEKLRSIDKLQNDVEDLEKIVFN